MSTYQQTIFILLFNKLKASHKFYGKKILRELYSDNKINIQGICSIISNRHQKIIKASIKDLEDCNLIYRVDNNKSKYSEKIYKLTKYGINVVEDDSNINV